MYQVNMKTGLLCYEDVTTKYIKANKIYDDTK
ncbi:hypothetical protein DJ93_4699 [Bacillus clarus]|uniref:Uncharacterized protein n=1 Tax=Bacillus clarus TaxID=2338372 RepID=A0A090ZKC2_9BACI|nr:hypothetical protein DJ93_4699 [Bacillus clarus]